MKKKTLMILYWDLGIGGIQKRIRDFVPEILHKYNDWNIYILLRRKAKDGFDSQIQTGKNIHILYYPFTGSIRVPRGFIFWIAWNIIRLKPTTIITYLYLLSAAVVIIRRIFFWISPRIVLNEGVVTSRHLAFDSNRLARYIVTLTYPHADAIVVPTQAGKADLIQNYAIPHDKIIVVPNWTNLSPMKPTAPKFDILYIGRFDEEKNPLKVVAITKLLVHKYPNIRVGMMGNGDLFTGLVRTITQENLSEQIQVIPFSQNVTSTLRKTKVLFVPSLAEGMPNVVLEAAMCGVPAVVHNFPGADEVVQHGITGYISKTDKEAATQISELLGSNHKRHNMSYQAQSYVTRTFTGNTQRRFIELLLSV